jgi:thioredoxin-dependent peroxiredoxin
MEASMRNSLWSVITFLALGSGVLLALPAASRGADAELKVGDKAPDFSLPGSDGKTYSLADFKGKQAVVIAWFPKAFTGGCTKECKSIHENADKLKALHIAYFTASVDTPDVNAKFAKSLEVDYPILSDPSKKAAKAYGVVHEGRPVAERWTFYIDKNGTIKEIDKGVQKRTEQAGEDIAAKVKALGLNGQ